jgi:hypothetical protein
VSGGVCGRTALVLHELPGWTSGQTPTMPTALERGRGLRQSRSGTASGCAPHELPCPRWQRGDHHVSALVAGVREATGHLSGRQPAADTSMAPTRAWPGVPDDRRPDASRPDGGRSGSCGRSSR